jgi:regulator of protease activity HflC (stomatin/prohibitin superfamily)
VSVDLSDAEIDPEIDRSLLSHTALAPYVRAFTVKPPGKAKVFINGKFSRTVGPGNYYFWKNSASIVFSKMR